MIRRRFTIKTVQDNERAKRSQTSYGEVLGEDVPDSAPNIADSTHIVKCNLNNLLQKEDTWTCFIIEFMLRDSAQVGHEINNRFRIQRGRMGEDPIDQ